MKSLPLSLGALAFVTALGSGCSATLFTLKPLNPPGMLTEDRVAVTLAKSDLSVTVGPLAHLQNKYMSFAMLVRNNSDRELAIRLQDAKVLINGKPVALLSQAWFDRQKRMARWTGALSAASGSLAQSNVLSTRDRYAGTANERRGDVGKTALGQQMERTLAAQQLFQASLNAGQVQSQLGQEYAAELAKASSVAWDDTYELRTAIVGSVPLWDQYRWRDETVPPRSWLLRCLFTDPDSAEALLGEQGGRVGVEIELGEKRFVYSFDTVLLRSYSEVSAELARARARAMAMRER